MMRTGENEKTLPCGRESDMVHLMMPRETIFGAGCLRSVGETAFSLGTRAFLVTGSESAQSDEVVDRVRRQLDEHGMNPTAFPMPEGCPDIEAVDSAAETCAENQCDVVIGVGEVGVIDGAKLVAIACGSGANSVRPFLVNEWLFATHWVPLVCIATPPITGAELSATAFVADRTNGVGQVLYHPCLIPEVVIMDAELTLPVPPAVTAVAGISAFAHALEAFVSSRADELTATLAAEAVRLVGRNLVRAVRDGADIEAKTALCLAAYLAGA
ncbi:MAG: iron-containing alcohol dehydrogenase, partial [Candidatus Hydrogenedentes bacterium]|nr:iron-containing alcohol dehydrogenase [Candidatus Hydrogenedentota bacterium]